MSEGGESAGKEVLVRKMSEAGPREFSLFGSAADAWGDSCAVQSMSPLNVKVNGNCSLTEALKH